MWFYEFFAWKKSKVWKFEVCTFESLKFAFVCVSVRPSSMCQDRDAASTPVRDSKLGMINSSPEFDAHGWELFWARNAQIFARFVNDGSQKFGARVEKLIAQPLEILEKIHKGYFAKFRSPVSPVSDDGSKFERVCSPYLHTKLEGTMY